MKAIIAGAGVGGLALALMLHRRGIEAVVYEQASEIREVGVGINILPHAIKELAALGLLPALDEVGIRTRAALRQLKPSTYWFHVAPLSPYLTASFSPALSSANTRSTDDSDRPS